jgi:hypothetical protein
MISSGRTREIDIEELIAELNCQYAPRKYRLRWSDAAATDLRNIWDYYAEVASRNVAARVPAGWRGARDIAIFKP